MCVQCSRRPKEGTGSPGTGGPDGCEPPYGFWELNLNPLEEQQVFLITESPLQFPTIFSYLKIKKKEALLENISVYNFVTGVVPPHLKRTAEADE